MYDIERENKTTAKPGRTQEAVPRGQRTHRRGVCPRKLINEHESLESTEFSMHHSFV
mgnify:CR=1 FL=1